MGKNPLSKGTNDLYTYREEGETQVAGIARARFTGGILAAIAALYVVMSVCPSVRGQRVSRNLPDVIGS